MLPSMSATVQDMVDQLTSYFVSFEIERQRLNLLCDGAYLDVSIIVLLLS